MLSSNILYKYKQLKEKMDAAYTVFRKDPTVTNASRHTTAAQAFTNFCVDTMAELAGSGNEDQNRDDLILSNIDNYKTCKKCGSELLYLVSEDRFIGSSEFVPEFPGWCHTCLIEHCLRTECTECTVAATPASCSYKEIKNIYKEG